MAQENEEGVGPCVSPARLVVCESGSQIALALGLEPEKVTPHSGFCRPSPPRIPRPFLTAPVKIQKFTVVWCAFAGTTTTANPRDHRIATTVKMPPKKAARPAQENISLGPQVREGELVFGGE